MFDRRAESPFGWLAALVTLLALTLAVPADGRAATDGQVFDDWTINCQPVPEEAGGGESCNAVFVVPAPEGQGIAMRMVAGYLGAGGGTPVGAIILPLGIRLSEGVLLKIDSNKEIRLPFDRCIQAGCQVLFPLNDEILGQLKRGLAAQVVFLDPAGNPQALPISLKGFTAAFNSLKQ